MHSREEYQAIVEKTMLQADKMVARMLPVHRTEGKEILRFLRQYGYIGFPLGEGTEFTIGPWIARAGYPAKQRDGIAIIPCFSDDVPPLEGIKYPKIAPGVFCKTDQVIVLYNVDRWSLIERVCTLLHEARHARQHVGKTLARLDPLDANESVHESNTWMFILHLLDAWGGDNWHSAVRREVSWLMGRDIVSCNTGQIVYVESSKYWTELNRIFGASKHGDAQKLRMSLVSLQANMEYWSQRNTALRPEQVCHSIVCRLYS